MFLPKQFEESSLVQEMTPPFGASDHCTSTKCKQKRNSYKKHPSAENQFSKLFHHHPIPHIVSLQKWFASMMMTPSNDIKTWEKNAVAAQTFIAPHPRLSPIMRMEIYRNQYWHRLLNILQENFPTLTRLFGYGDFNHCIAIPYLTQCPSQDPSLGQLGKTLPHWLEKNYFGLDQPLVRHAAHLDWAFLELFTAPNPQKCTPRLSLLSKKLDLQSHVRLFTFPFDLFSFRKELLQKSVEHWIHADFPPLCKKRTYHFVLFRKKSLLHTKEISEGEWFFLQAIAQGKPIERACSNLEKRGGNALREAFSHLHEWVAGWIRNRWLREKNMGKH